MATREDFHIGDRVRVSNAERAWDYGAEVTEGDTGKITAISKASGSSCPLRVEFEDDYWYLNPNDVELVTKTVEREEDVVSAPSHYRSHPSGIEVIEITKHMGFLDGNVIKYVLRAPYKGKEIQDLKKAQQYLTWLIEEKEAASE